MRPNVPAPSTTAVTVCVLGQPHPDWLAALRDGLPAAARVVTGVDEDLRQALVQLAAQSPQGDLVLVRAGCLLPPHWFARIRAALHLGDVLAVAPLRAACLAGIDPPNDASQLARLDALAYVLGQRQVVDVARLDGPLLALRAEALALLAEDTDCLDAAAVPAPWRLVQMQDLLVAMPGADADRRGELAGLAESLHMADAADALDPGYPGLDGKPVVLHVCHGWGGGAARWIADLAGADSARHHLLLESHGSFERRCHGEHFTLRDARASDGPVWRRFTPAQGIADSARHAAPWFEFVRSLLAEYAVTGVVVSSLIGHSLDALRTGLPTTLVVHDHYPLWPLLHCNFGDRSVSFDGHALAAGLAAAGKDFEFAHRQPEYWQRLRQAFVEAACAAHSVLVAPSDSAMAAQLRLAPELEALKRHVIAHGLAPWPEPTALPEPPPRPRLRLLVPGRVRAGKGAELLHALVPRLGEHAELILLGAGAEGMDFFGHAGVHVVLDYEHAELPQLLAQLRPDAALLVPTVAETFSYTLSEMRSLGLAVIATAVGALAERIDDGVDGLLVAPEAEALRQRIAALADDRGPLESVRKYLADNPEGGSLERMRAAWDAILPGAPVAAALSPALATPADLQARALGDAVRGLQDQLAQRGATVDQLEADLERRLEWALQLEREQRQTAVKLDQAGVKLDEVHEELDQRSAWALSLDHELQQVRPEYERILQSRSWRLTRPLRVLTRALRRGRESVRFRWARARSLHGRTRASLRRRGALGTAKRIRQEFRGRQLPARRYAAPEPQGAFQPFAVPTSDAPDVSVIIPAYGHLAYTAACLRSLAEHAADTAFEVIVVDDASPDDSADRLAEVKGLRLHRNVENLGFVGTCNAGAELARGEFVVFLNNDTLVTAGWLEALRACFAECADAGLVGARLLYPDGRLQEAGGIVFSDGSGWNYGRFDDPDDPRVNFRRQVDYCSGAAIMLRRELFEQLGGFDSRYAPAYYEDTDLAFQVRAAGRQVYVEPRALVVHFEGVSNGTDEDADSGLKRFQKINRAKFVDQWREALAAQPAPIDDPARAHLAATWRAAKRVLIVDASTPEPDQDSGSVRLVNIMRVLGQMGCQVSFLPDNLARFDKYTPQLQAEGVEALYHPFTESLPQFYRQRGREFDLIMVSRHYVLAHHLGLIRLHAPQARLAFDTVDLHYLRETRAAELDPRPELKRQAAATRGKELKLIHEADVTLVVSAVEQKLLARDAPDARVEVLSNVHDIQGSDTGFEARRDLLFVGGFQHPPNIDAMLWFVGEVLPAVHAELPELKLHIVGSKMVAEIEALASANVVVHGFVEDIEPMLESARISIAPLRYGAGVKGKVNMAMSRGLPVVATPMAVEGIDVQSGRDVLVGEGAADFAAAVIALYRDPALWQTLSDNGSDNVRRQFSFDAARATLERLLDPDS